MTDFAFLESAPYERYNRVDTQTVNAVNIFAQTDRGAAFVTTEYRPRYEGQRLGTNSRFHNIEAQTAIKRFCDSGGKYYLSYHCMSGSFHNPLGFLAHIESKAYTFRRIPFADMFIRCRMGKAPCVIFHGNLNEISAAFEYYIYDEGILTAVIDAVNRILARNGQAGWEYRDGEVGRKSI